MGLVMILEVIRNGNSICVSVGLGLCAHAFVFYNI